MGCRPVAVVITHVHNYEISTQIKWSNRNVKSLIIIIIIIIIINLTVNGLSPGGSGYYACT